MNKLNKKILNNFINNDVVQKFKSVYVDNKTDKSDHIQVVDAKMCIKNFMIQLIAERIIIKDYFYNEKYKQYTITYNWNSGNINDYILTVNIK